MSRHPGAVYGASKGSAPGSKHYYRAVWSASKWDEFVETRATGTVAQVCAGGSFVGQVRIDLLPTPATNVRADMLALPLRDKSFDTVCCDPSYTIGYPDRVRLQRELVRVARQRVLFKAPWLLRGSGWHTTEVVLLASHTVANVALLSVFAPPSPGQESLAL